MLSVILTTFNRAYYLDKVIKKLYLQTFKNFELIIIDDNSTDNTNNIINNMNYNNLYYYKNIKNLGYAKSALEGLNKAHFKYIIFITDDDTLVDNSFFESAIKLLEKDKSIDSVFARLDTIKNKEIIQNNYPFKQRYTSIEFIQEIKKLRFIFMEHFGFSTIIFKTKILKQTKPFSTIFDEAGSVDISTIIKYLYISRNIAFLDIRAYLWTFEPTSLSGQKKDDLTFRSLQIVSGAIDIYDYFDDKEICKNTCNAYIKYAFDAILSDYEQLNNEVNFKNSLEKIKHDVFIYGRGWTGLALKDFLSCNGVNIKYFIDDYKINFEDTISLEELKMTKKRITVIISSYKYKDIYNIYKKLLNLENIQILDLVSN